MAERWPTGRMFILWHNNPERSGSRRCRSPRIHLSRVCRGVHGYFLWHRYWVARPADRPAGWTSRCISG